MGPNFEPLGSVAQVDSGPAFKSAMFQGPDEGIRLVRGDNIEPGALRWDRIKTWPHSEMAGYEHLLIESKDLILGMDRPVISSGLKLARVRQGDLPALLVQRVARIRPHAVAGEYLYHWLSSPQFAMHLQGTATGTQLPHVTLKGIREYAVPRFGPDEERRIVDLLEDHLSRIDAANAYLEVARRRAAVLHDQLLASELTSPACADIPLRELLAVGLSNGRSVPTQDGGFPVLRLTALRGGRIDLNERKAGAWTADDAARFLVKKGDFLISRGNGSLRLVGRGGLVVDEPDPVAFPDTLIRARPIVEKIAPEFLALVWNAPTVRRQIERAARTTAGIYKVNQKDLGAVSLPAPSLADQVRVVRAVTASRKALGRLSGEVGAASARSAALRRSLLVAAFSGGLTAHAANLSVAGEMIDA